MQSAPPGYQNRWARPPASLLQTCGLRENLVEATPASVFARSNDRARGQESRRVWPSGPGLSVHGIQKLESGTTHPYRDTAARLIRALQLSTAAPPASSVGP